ncbi:MAG: hypothetical protein ABIQ04_01145 [Candidatus Saccharimonadales bacterium]
MSKVVEQKREVVPYIDMEVRQFASILITGLGVGIVIWALEAVLATYVFGPIMCHDAGQASCRSVDTYSEIVSSVFGTLAGLVALVRLRVYRPLLVVLSALIALWGLFVVTRDMTWALSLTSSAVLYAFVYGLFSWVARIRSFLICVVFIIIALVFIRFAIN